MYIIRKDVNMDLDPQFKEDLLNLLSNLPDTWWIISGFRSNTEQRKLYNIYLATNKNKAAPPGKSAHNYGLAVDVVLDGDPEKKGLQAIWNVRLLPWLRLFAAIKKHPRLKSGISFGDGSHIERYKWKKHINLTTYDPIS
jgi:hypothetical protein